ncbi:LOW QUALITY PROTEIN: galectin-9C-like [Pelecanus crispus]|uniref:LOW QUALITY PROTEIN: galectin-9C-like n=1 Tax=Pelecanus crispus TaxID=36300 RepID=UPI003F5D3E41
MDPQLPIINPVTVTSGCVSPLLSPPSVPFLGYIFGGLSAGRMVIIQGHVRPNAKRFSVALLCVGGDVALRLHPRFSPGTVLGCTARLGGLWGPEQACTPRGLHPGGTLELLISAQEHGYQVAVNGQHALEFLHRLPLSSVQALEVTGDVTLTCISFTGPGVPFHMVLSKGPLGLIQPITIVGTVHANANRFHANLCSSSSGDVVLHVNPRLREAVLVRNTQQRGCWGPEERHTEGAMPFLRGQPFQGWWVPVPRADTGATQLEIQPLSHAFALWVNGRHICDYAHRVPPATIDRLEVAGDVTLACVKC